MTATELAKLVIDSTTQGVADDALADRVADELEALPLEDAYHFVVQVAHGLGDSEDHKVKLRDFNQKLAKREKFSKALERIGVAKAEGKLTKPATP
jgi:hypothetical protein